jgi:hypothetical protein
VLVCLLRMSESCFQKCVYKYNDNDLNLGEMSCIDRCTAKYLEAAEKVGDRISYSIDASVLFTSCEVRSTHA